MSLFPSAAAIKAEMEEGEVKDEPEDEPQPSNGKREEEPIPYEPTPAPYVEPPNYSSFDIARLNAARLERERNKRIQKKAEEIKDQMARRRFTMRDSSEDDDDDIIAVAYELARPTTSRLERKNDSKGPQPPMRKRDRKRSPSPPRPSSSSSSSTDSDERRKKRRKEKKIKKEKKHHRRKDSSEDERRAKKRRKEKKRRRSSSSSSSSSSDSETGSSKKKKKREKSPEKVEPTVRQMLSARDRWCFIKKSEINFSSANYFVLHRLWDPQNRLSEHFVRSDLTAFFDRFKNVMGGHLKMDKLVYGAKKQVAAKVKRIFNSNLQFSDKPERVFLRKPMMDGDDFMEISHQKLDEDLARFGGDGTVMGSSGRTVDKIGADEVRDVSARHTLLNTKVNRDRKNVSLWLEFIKCEEEKQRLENGEHPPPALKQNLLERKMSILSEALKANPASAPLLLLQLEWNRDKESEAERIKAWRNVLSKLPNSISLWRQYIADITNDNKLFRLPEFESALSKCEAEMDALLSGKMRSHKPEEGTAAFLLETLVLRIRVLLEMGCYELAIVTLQSALELNMCRAAGGAPADPNRSFAAFFDSGAPMVGEPGASGWSKFQPPVTVPPNTDRMQDLEAYEAELERIGREGGTDAEMHLAVDRARIKYLWRPIRRELEDDSEEIESFMSSGEVQQRVFREDLRPQLFYELCELLGAQFYGRPTRSLAALLSVDFPFSSSFAALARPPPGLITFVDRLLTFFAGIKVHFVFARIKTNMHFLSLEDLSPCDLVLRHVEHIEVIMKEYMKDQSLGRRQGPIMTTIRLLGLMELSNLLLRDSSGIGFRDEVRQEWWKQVEFVRLSISRMDRSERVELDRMSDQSAALLLCLAVIVCRSCSTAEELCCRVTALFSDQSLREKDPPAVPSVQRIAVLTQLEAANQRMCGRAAAGEAPNKGCDEFVLELGTIFGDAHHMLDVVRMYFFYATSSSDGDQRLEGVFDVLSHSIERSNRREQLHETRLIQQYYARILKLHRKYTSSVMALQNFVTYVRKAMPEDPFFLRESIEMRCRGSSALVLFNELARAAKERPSHLLSVARMYAAWLYSARRLSRTEDRYDRAAAHHIANVFREEAARWKEPLLWRCAQRLVTDFGIKKLVDEVHTSATADCVWSRELHLEYAAALPEKFEDVLMLLYEKNMRFRAEREEVEALREKYGGAAKAKAEARKWQEDEDEERRRKEEGDMEGVEEGEGL